MADVIRATPQPPPPLDDDTSIAVAQPTRMRARTALDYHGMHRGTISSQVKAVQAPAESVKKAPASQLDLILQTISQMPSNGHITTIVQEQVRDTVQHEVESVIREDVRSIVREELKNVGREEVKNIVREEVRSIVQEEVQTIVQEQVSAIVQEQVSVIVQEQVSRNCPGTGERNCTATTGQYATRQPEPIVCRRRAHTTRKSPEQHSNSVNEHDAIDHDRYPLLHCGHDWGSEETWTRTRPILGQSGRTLRRRCVEPKELKESKEPTMQAAGDASPSRETRGIRRECALRAVTRASSRV